jgi:hypothetical protein
MSCCAAGDDSTTGREGTLPGDGCGWCKAGSSGAGGPHGCAGCCAHDPLHAKQVSYLLWWLVCNRCSRVLHSSMRCAWLAPGWLQLHTPWPRSAPHGRCVLHCMTCSLADDTPMLYHVRVGAAPGSCTCTAGSAALVKDSCAAEYQWVLCVLISDAASRLRAHSVTPLGCDHTIHSSHSGDRASAEEPISRAHIFQ